MYESLLASSGSYIILFLLMAAVGILGVFPPSKIIYVVSGFLVSMGSLALTPVLLVGAFGHTIGNWVQYEIGRYKGYGFLEKILDKYPLFSIKEIKKVQVVFQKKGAWFFFVGKILDPIKLFISFCVGFSKMNRALFFILAFLGSLIWAGVFTLLGFYFGRSLEQFGYIGAVIVVLAGIFMLIFYKYMNSKEIEELLD